MADERDRLFREIDEELRREQLKKIWDKYGTYLLAIPVLIVLAIAGYKMWEGRRVAAIETAGSRYENAARLAEGGKPEEALAAFRDIAKSGPDGYGMLAQLRLAGSAAQAGRVDEAVRLYDELAARRGAEPLLRDFARLEAAALRIDAADWTEMQNRLNDLAGDNNPWRYSARELLGLAAWRAGKLEEARQSLGRLVADAKVPPGIAERARVLMSMIAAAELAKSGAQPVGEPAEAAKEGRAGSNEKAPKKSTAKGAKGGTQK